MTQGKKDSVNARSTERKSFALILFTKVPKPGIVKTRFISKWKGLSEEEAASLYSCLLQDTLAAVRDFGKRRGLSLIVSFAPRNERSAIQKIVAEYVEHADYVPQEGSNVTQKVRNAFDHAFNQGYQEVSLIPGDHPDLDARLLAQSFDYLGASSSKRSPCAVLGPTCDGGAYLLGFNRLAFSRIRFRLEDTYNVCASIVKSARDRGICYTILDNRSDIDDWEDIRLFLQRGRYVHTKTYSFLHGLPIPINKSDICNLSIVIPAFNEERTITGALTSLDSQTDRNFESILVDGDSSDLTVEGACGRVDKTVFVNKASRRRQENVGALGAKGSALLFLHADMKLPRTIVRNIETSLKRPSVIGGGSLVAFDGRGFKYRFLDALRRCGSRLLRIHGISSTFFVKRSMFFAVGGFREDVMEEAVDLERRLSKYGRFITLNDISLSSPRRFEKHGFGLVTVIWVVTVLLTVLGLHITSVENKLWRR
jgi:glycosyltransferase A (GT-A) superfamily protein (DUF2064 family)